MLCKHYHYPSPKLFQLPKLKFQSLIKILHLSSWSPIMNLTALSVSCKWNHMIIVSLWLPFYNLLYLFPTKYSWHPFWKLSKDIYEGLFLDFLFYSICPLSVFIRILVPWLSLLCIVCFKVRKYETPSFLVFKIVLAISSPWDFLWILPWIFLFLQSQFCYLDL